MSYLTVVLFYFFKAYFAFVHSVKNKQKNRIYIYIIKYIVFFLTNNQGSSIYFPWCWINKVFLCRLDPLGFAECLKYVRLRCAFGYLADVCVKMGVGRSVETKVWSTVWALIFSFVRKEQTHPR